MCRKCMAGNNLLLIIGTDSTICIVIMPAITTSMSMITTMPYAPPNAARGSPPTQIELPLSKRPGDLRLCCATTKLCVKLFH